MGHYHRGWYKRRKYEFLFNSSFKKLTYNGGVEFSKPKYKSDRITGGIQQKEIFGLFNQVAYNG